MNIFRAVELMGAVLDLRTAQHRVISSNIANEETPGYRAKEIDANSVNLELEMAKLSDNAMQYKAIAELLARRFRGLINVIREGR